MVVGTHMALAVPNEATAVALWLIYLRKSALALPTAKPLSPSWTMSAPADAASESVQCVGVRACMQLLVM